MKRPAPWIKYLAAVVIVASAAGFFHNSRVTEPYFSLAGEDISAAIMINTAVDSGRRAALYNSELLQNFSEDHVSTVEIRNGFEKPECWDSLIRGKVDFIITDSVPHRYRNRVIESPAVTGKYRWVTSVRESRLLNTANMWLSSFLKSRDNKFLEAKYLKAYAIYPQAKEYIGDGKRISPYDAIIKKYGRYIGWDWRLLSSVIYQESKFTMGVESRSAIGLMQIKQTTADYYGVNDVYDPDLNIRAGALHLQRLSKMFASQGIDSANVIKFSLASYNAGEGRIAGCMSVAEEKGFDPKVWDDVVKVFPYISDFSGAVTKRYVADVIDRYQRYRLIAPE